MVRIFTEACVSTPVELDEISKSELRTWGSSLVGSGAVSHMGTAEDINSRLKDTLNRDLDDLRQKCGSECTLRVLLENAYSNDDSTKIFLECDPVQIDSNSVTTIEEAEETAEFLEAACELLHDAAAERLKATIERVENTRLRALVEARRAARQ